jgi:hypothetical protein
MKEIEILPSAFKEHENKEMAFEQYKLLLESINKASEVREASNNFWIAVNTLGMSAIAYIRDSQNLIKPHKPIVLWVLISLGVSLCLAWLSYLQTIKKNVDIRNSILLAIESYLPLKIFTQILKLSGRKEGKSSLTFKEMIVPSLFLLGYIAFAFCLLYFQDEVITTPDS